jgi:hypothetical protein
MTDHDVEREIAANQQRQVANENEAEDDGALLDMAERVVNPLVNLIDTDDVDAGDVDAQRRENDAEQRRGE